MKKTIHLLAVLTCLQTASAWGQPVTFAKILDFYPMNPETGQEVSAVQDGYILLTSNACVSYTTTIPYCRTMTKLDEYGNVQWMLELDIMTSWRGNFIELDDAYYVVGTDQIWSPGVPLLKISKQGQLLWKKKILNLPYQGYGSGIRVNVAGEIVIFGAYRRMLIDPDAFLPFLLTVTTEGETIDFFPFNEDYHSTLAIGQLQSTSDGNYWMSYFYCPIGCFIDATAGLVVMRSDGFILLRKELPELSVGRYSCGVMEVSADEYVYQWYSMQQVNPPWDLNPPALYYMNAQGVVHDSLIFHNQIGKDVFYTHALWNKGIVGCGFHKQDNAGPYNRLGWIFRVDEHRQLVWERTCADTTNSGYVVNGIVHINQSYDGGYIACGEITNQMTGGFETHAWLLKLDSTGCLTPGCSDINVVAGVESAAFAQEAEIRCAPNPASVETYVTLPAEFPERDVIVVLLSPEGKPLYRQAYTHPGIRIPLYSAGSGMHYVAAYRQGRLLGVAKLVVQG